jgi:hypothetical protein
MSSAAVGRPRSSRDLYDDSGDTAEAIIPPPKKSFRYSIYDPNLQENGGQPPLRTTGLPAPRADHAGGQVASRPLGPMSKPLAELPRTGFAFRDG